MWLTSLILQNRHLSFRVEWHGRDKWVINFAVRRQSSVMGHNKGANCSMDDALRQGGQGLIPKACIGNAVTPPRDHGSAVQADGEIHNISDQLAHMLCKPFSGENSPESPRAFSRLMTVHVYV